MLSSHLEQYDADSFLHFRLQALRACKWLTVLSPRVAPLPFVIQYFHFFFLDVASLDTLSGFRDKAIHIRL